MEPDRSVPLRRIGDTMQSEASRLLEWVAYVRTKHIDTLEMPYEVQMATLGLRSAIDEWTAARIAEASALSEKQP